MTTKHFPHQLVPTAGYLISSPTPILQQFGSGDRGGFTIVSGSSGRHWHVIKAEKDCHYGQVFLAMELSCSPSTGSWEGQGREHFAIKKTDLEVFANVDESIAIENPITAVSVLQFLGANGPHQNVIEVAEVLKVDENIYTIMPYCRGGELYSLISKCTRLPESNAKAIFGDVLAGMSYVHALGICHRDMSAENILLDDEGRGKIIDSGMALMMGPPGVSLIPPTGSCGKTFYMAPEVAKSDRAYDGFAVDVWACGILLFMMLAGYPPFENPIPTEDHRCDIVAVKGNLKNLVRSWNLPMSDKAIDLIQSCLQYDPRRRPTIDQLLHHGWFAT